MSILTVTEEINVVSWPAWDPVRIAAKIHKGGFQLFLALLGNAANKILPPTLQR
jgi:hypothetical protein